LPRRWLDDRGLGPPLTPVWEWFKEIIATVEGKGVYSRLKFESGVHRVQRSCHRVAGSYPYLYRHRGHSSRGRGGRGSNRSNDIRVDIFRSSGPGGQSVNTNGLSSSNYAYPTGMVVSCQDEKSQHKNKAKALKILRRGDGIRQPRRNNLEISEKRRLQVGTGERSERIRTYNFPQAG